MHYHVTVPEGFKGQAFDLTSPCEDTARVTAEALSLQFPGVEFSVVWGDCVLQSYVSVSA